MGEREREVLMVALAQVLNSADRQLPVLDWRRGRLLPPGIGGVERRDVV